MPLEQQLKDSVQKMNGLCFELDEAHGWKSLLVVLHESRVGIVMVRTDDYEPSTLQCAWLQQFEERGLPIGTARNPDDLDAFLERIGEMTIPA